MAKIKRQIAIILILALTPIYSLAYDAGQGDIIMSAITQNISGTADLWGAVALAQYGLGDSVDRDGLTLGVQNILTGRRPVITDLERCVIGQTAIGIDSSDILSIILSDDLLLTNAVIFALIAVDSGEYDIPQGAKWDRQSLIDKIISLQMDNGGWGLSPSMGADVDVTAMALTALSPYTAQSVVSAPVEAGVSFLSAKKPEDNVYSSMGVRNSNSNSAVIIALCSLGIDPTDAVDGLMTFVTPDNMYGNTGNTVSNEMSSMQGLMALIAYQRFTQSGEPFNIYKFSKMASEEPDIPIEEEVLPEESPEVSFDVSPSPSPTEEPIQEEEFFMPYMKRFVPIILGAMLLCGCNADIVSNTVQPSPSPSPSPSATVSEVQNEVQVSPFPVESAKSTAKSDAKSNPAATSTPTLAPKLVAEPSPSVAPKTNTVSLNVRALGSTVISAKVELKEGESVFDVLKRTLRENNILFDYSGSAKSAYVRGINDLYEFDKGPESGWKYKVNGVASSESCGSYILKNGDEIDWYYTLKITE